MKVLFYRILNIICIVGIGISSLLIMWPLTAYVLLHQPFPADKLGDLGSQCLAGNNTACLQYEVYKDQGNVYTPIIMLGLVFASMSGVSFWLTLEPSHWFGYNQDRKDEQGNWKMGFEK